MRRVLLLDLSVDPKLYRPEAHWRALLGDTPVDRLHASAGARLPADLRPWTHVLITGSEASILEPAPWFAPTEALIRHAVEAGLAVLGSCFGHQLIVRALAGPAHLRRAPAPELGWYPVETLVGGPLTIRAGRRIHAFCCHLDEVVDLPDTFEVLARTPRCAVHAYRLRDRPVWGIQSHPEIPPAAGQALLRGLAEQRPDLAEPLAAALAQPPRDDAFGPAMAAAFLEVVP